jgi:uncharacterized repeat protein (TIGR02543 family)
LYGNSTSWGGGIYNYSTGTLTVTNSTLSGNTATHGGGGIVNFSTLNIANSTLTGNSASSYYGGGIDNARTLTFSNNLVAGNSAPTGKEINHRGDTFISQGHNLLGTNGSSGVTGGTLDPSDLILAGSISTAIGPLANNGGPTQTHMLVVGSPAINAGNNTLIPAGIPTDQRGYSRIQNGAVDIGAVEVGNAYPLTVSKTGSGTVTSTTSGAIDCGTLCTADLAPGTSITLTATPDTGSTTFTGWSGACTGTSDCTVTMDAAKSVSATFTLNRYELTVSKAGTGTGTVISTPAGINCGSDCNESYNHGQSVSLTATADSGFAFTGWSGACSGVGACTVTMDGAKTVTATFSPVYTLTVTKSGSGTGTVTSTPAGINCGSDCTEEYPIGTAVTLTASPASGSTFSGWSGACTRTGTCTVTMDVAKSVTATFTPSYTVTATAGPGGTISPASRTVNHGAFTTFTITPDPGYSIASVTGCNGNLNGITYTTGIITEACTVTATFTRLSTLAAVGIYRNGAWYLDKNGNGLWNGATVDRYCLFGQAGDQPVVGDWNGDGYDEIGVRRGSAWYLDYNGNCRWDGSTTDRYYASFGLATDQPVVGDWNGDGKDGIGVKRGSASWYLDKNDNGLWNGTATDLYYASFGLAADQPVVGDWNGDGKDSIGVKRGSASWYLDKNDNGLWNGTATDRYYPRFGLATDQPVVGDWNGDGKDGIGVKRGSTWYLDKNDNGLWNGTATDRYYPGFGLATDLPVAGRWKP